IEALSQEPRPLGVGQQIPLLNYGAARITAQGSPLAVYTNFKCFPYQPFMLGHVSEDSVERPHPQALCVWEWRCELGSSVCKTPWLPT
ncbi:MAG: hypothetical protein ACR2JB_16330, partial [Bryobacteraceae bacterium]